MPQLRVGICLASLRQPLKKALHTAARLGADAVEIDGRNELQAGELSHTALRQVRKMLNDLNLRVCAVTFRTRRGYDCADDLERRIEATKQTMKMAFDLGAGVVVNQIGQIEEAGAARELLCAALTDIGNYGQRVGAMLAAQTGTEDGPALAGLIESLPEGSIGVDLHPGNLIVNGFSAVDAVQSLGRHVLHVHAADATGDRARLRGIETPLGRGSADFPQLIGMLEEHVYRGYFTIERERSDDAEFEIGQAVKYLRSL